MSVGPGTITRSRGRCAGNGLRAGFLRREGADLRFSVAAALLGRNLVLGRCSFQLLELQLHLVDQTRLALVARAKKVALELLDRQPQMRQGFALVASARPRRLGTRLRKLRVARQQQLLQRRDIVGERIIRAHRAKMESQDRALVSPAIAQ